MNWLNLYGLIFMAVIMVPNIIVSVKRKDLFVNKYNNKTIIMLEQVGRFSSFILMVINIPYLCLGYFFNNAETIYIITNAVLCFLYCLCWLLFRGKSCVFKSLALSVLPSVMFIFSGIITLNIPLIVASVIFTFCHITISYKNAVM
ncbi:MULTISPECIES: hypothetical protein [unclassified Ruminococcus]|uniref:hypothetical protein n=1 Tax=unclassified Ruminococcus TaxID=2608920 RepID=UPI002108C337|nr:MULTISPECIES: hypothetical protein [unclassified Ruminococcus]MCQ4023159.1 hypothetical protein [Ruminococcus sp. zg-924]MCQ4115070.1 hypothetical protein [Ruminococcus sp. zg-921]